MTKVRPLGRNWMRKQELASALGVSTRWISKLVHRGEVERVLIDGTPWFRPREQEQGELEVGTPSNTFDNQPVKGGNSAPKKSPKQGGTVGTMGTEEQFSYHLDLQINFEELYREEKQKALEARDEIRTLNHELVDVRDENAALCTELSRTQTELAQLQRQNEALLRALEQRTLVQGLLLWLKNFWTRFTRR